MLLKNKVAIITGAGRGIGKSIALAFAQQGCQIAAIARSQQELGKLSEEIHRMDVRSAIYSVDVSNYNVIRKTIKDIITEFDRIDILVNAAGVYGPMGLFADNNIHDWHQAININLLGAVFCTQPVLPSMIKNKSGKIINFSGGGAVNPFPRFSSYATSKAAVVRFTETLAEELKPHNIQVNAIAPGAVNTKLFESALSAGPKVVGEDFYKKLEKQKESGGDPAELSAQLALFLASGKSFDLTGKLLSAKWDNWQNFTKEEISKLNKSSLFTLRRIDNKYFKEI